MRQRIHAFLSLLAFRVVGEVLTLGEISVDKSFKGLYRCENLLAVRPKRRALFALSVIPRLKGLKCSIKGFYRSRIHTVLATSVERCREAFERTFYGILRFSIIVCRERSHDAVAVKARFREYGLRIGRIFHTDRFFRGLANAFQHPSRALFEPAALYAVSIEGRKRQGVARIKEQVPIFQYAAYPFTGFHDLLYTDSTVMVAIEILQKFTVEFQAVFRATQCRPELLVQFSQMGDIFAAVDTHSGYASQGTEFPRIITVVHRFVIF